MVNKANMRLWVAGLLSGRFNQGRGTLKRVGFLGSTYCCLGVACQIAKENGVELTERRVDSHTYFDNGASALPNAVVAWLGVSSDDPQVNEARSAIDANDRLDRMEFSQIAAALIEYYELEETDAQGQ